MCCNLVLEHRFIWWTSIIWMIWSIYTQISIHSVGQLLNKSYCKRMFNFTSDRSVLQKNHTAFSTGVWKGMPHAIAVIFKVKHSWKISGESFPCQAVILLSALFMCWKTLKRSSGFWFFFLIDHYFSISTSTLQWEESKMKQLEFALGYMLNFTLNVFL